VKQNSVPERNGLLGVGGHGGAQGSIQEIKCRAPQIQPVSFRHVDVDLLNQPRRQGAAAGRKQMLEKAKGELRELFDKD
jgi:hypothetical protein